MPRPTSVPIKIKKIYAEVSAVVEPLLHGILQESKDGRQSCSGLETRLTDNVTEEEAADLVQIRTLYLPEIILAYNTMLCTAGHVISRDELLTSMDLATIVASERSGLAEAFVKSGRMSELVKAFAETSKIMLKLNETGKARKEKKGLGGRSLAIWEING